MTDRQKVPSNRPWKAGYSRAIRIGNLIEVSGTVSAGVDGTPLYPGDMGAQVAECLRVIESAVVDLGGQIGDVSRTQLFLTDISRWKEAATAHERVFGSILPASSFIGVNELLHPAFLVEIEATAVVEPTL